MTIVGHVQDQTSHVLFIKTDTPTVALIALSGFTDVTNESMGHTYVKTFRYSLNGITFSEWLPLTNPNISAIDINGYNSFVVEYKYDPKGDTTLTFDSVTINATQDSNLLTCGIVFTNSVFAKLLDCQDIEILEWYLNVTEKLFNTGILAKYISREDGSGSPEDFILFWKSITKFFGFYVVWSRKWRDFHENNDLIIEYLRQKGLYIEDFQSLDDCQKIMAAFNKEMRKRGTLQVTQTYSISSSEIHGELLRLIGYETGDEFIFNPYKDEHLGWCIDTASPLFKSMFLNENANKAWEKNLLLDPAAYPEFGADSFSILPDDADNDGNTIKSIQLYSAGTGAIGWNNNPQFAIPVDNELDYLIAFKIKFTSCDSYRFGIDALDINYNTLDLISNKDGSDTNNTFIGSTEPPFNKYIQVYFALYNFSKTPFSQDVMNWGVGNNLIMIPDVRFIVPRIQITNGIFNIYELEILPLQTTYERGWIQSKNFISNWILNKNQKYTINQLEQIYRHYFIPYDSYCKITNIGDDLYNDIDIPFVPFQETYHWIGGAYTCASGTLTYTSLFQVSDSTLQLTGILKANDPMDPDYIAPFTDLVLCPVPTTTTTSTTTTSTTSTSTTSSTTTTSTSTTTTSTSTTSTTTTVAPHNVSINNNQATGTIAFVDLSVAGTYHFGPIAAGASQTHLVAGSSFYTVAVKLTASGFVDVNGDVRAVAGGATGIWTNISTPIFVTSTD